MDVQEKRRYLIWMGFALENEHRFFFELLENYDNNPYELFKAAQNGKFNFGERFSGSAQRLKRAASERYIDDKLNRLKALNISVALFDDDEYPLLLKFIEIPPPMLYYRGVLKGDITLPLALIGSRKPSNYAISQTRKLARELAEQGVTIVSGLAYGLDAQASLGALDAQQNEYPTVAVLGSGVDVIYPHTNTELYNKIIERGCAVVSEFIPGTAPLGFNFVRRNRIISGISKGVIVAEAGEKSGTSITVDFALEQGRDVFILPGRINDPKCSGSNAMLRNGCGAIALGADDVLSEYGMSAAQRKERKVFSEALTPTQSKIYVTLLNGEKSFDELCDLISVDVEELNSTLTDMELSGIIKRSPGRVYFV